MFERRCVLLGLAAAIAVVASPRLHAFEGAAPAASPDAVVPSGRIPPSAIRSVDDRFFVDRIASLSAFVERAGALSLRRARAEAVRGYAGEAIDAHALLMQDLGAAVGGPIKVVPSVRQEASLEALTLASEHEFDAFAVDAFGETHREIRDLLRAYLEAGRDEKLKTFARAAQPIVEEHLSRAFALRRTIVDRPGG